MCDVFKYKQVYTFIRTYNIMIYCHRDEPTTDGNLFIKRGKNNKNKINNEKFCVFVRYT